VQEIETLLICHARNDTNQWPVLRILNTKLIQQIDLTALFASQVLGGVIRDQPRILFGIPLSVVHAVEDAVQVRCTILKNALQSATKFRGANLLAVLFADGRQFVRKYDASLEYINVAVKLQLFRVVKFSG
jgi:hypothetical protein